MSAVPRSNSPLIPFELRNATLALTALVLKTTDLELLARALEEQFGATPLFDHDPVVLDLAQVRDDPQAIDFAALAAMLRERRMLAIGVEGGSAEQTEAAAAAGLGQTSTFATVPRAEVLARAEAATAAAVRPLVAAPDARPTLVIERPLRSGQQVYARGGDLVVLGVVNFGAEVIADGSIHVYAPLRGRAIAGARGNTAARIYASCMEPQLAAIAGTYRTTDVPLPADVWGKPAQMRLDGAQLVVEPLKF